MVSEKDLETAVGAFKTASDEMEKYRDEMFQWLRDIEAAREKSTKEMFEQQAILAAQAYANWSKSVELARHVMNEAMARLRENFKVP